MRPQRVGCTLRDGCGLFGGHGGPCRVCNEGCVMWPGHIGPCCPPLGLKSPEPCGCQESLDLREALAKREAAGAVLSSMSAQVIVPELLRKMAETYPQAPRAQIIGLVKGRLEGLLWQLDALFEREFRASGAEK